MFGLAVILICVVVIWIARARWLSRQHKGNMSLMHRIRDYVVEGDLDNALHSSATSPYTGGAVIYEGLSLMGRPIEEISSAMNIVAQGEDLRIDRGKRWLRGLAVIAPLAGAAGTLAGICDALRDAAEKTPGTESLLNPEIADAIVTSVAGLGVGVVAIVALICLDGACAKAKSRLRALAIEFTDLLKSPA